MILDLKNKNEFWEGWNFEDDRLISPNGQAYTKKSIEATFFEKQIPDISKLLIHPGCRDCTRSN